MTENSGLEGALLHRSINSKTIIWSSVWCVVNTKEEYLSIYQHKKDIHNSSKLPIRRYDLNNLSGVYSSSETVFSIKCPHKVVFLSSNKYKISQWIKLFTSIINKPTKEELELAKQKELKKQRELEKIKELKRSEELKKQQEIEKQRELQRKKLEEVKKQKELERLEKLKKQKELEERKKEEERLRREKLKKQPRVIYKPKPRTKEEVVKLEKVSIKKKEYHNKNYVSASKLNSKEFIEKKEKAKKTTNDILSKPCTGNPNDKSTLLHVLSGFSKSQGKECMFTNDNSNKNSQFIGSMGSTKNQNCVLVLNDLADVIADNDEEEAKTDDKQNKLKKQIINIREDIKNNKKNDVVESLKVKLGKAHGIDSKYIRINDIYYGSAHIDYDIITNLNKRGNPAGFSEELKNEFSSYKDAKLHPLFFEESFNISDFDERGHKKFDNGTIYKVGPSGNEQNYQQPTGWTRYGLKVLDGRYGSDDSWLHPFQDRGNWYRAYHGTSGQAGKSIIGDNNEPYFRPGSGQVRMQSGDDNLNSLSGGGKIQRGVYCSPVPSTAEGYCRQHVTITTTEGPKTFKFMFQVCVDPHKIQFCSGVKDYWVVPHNCPEAIRPYGILLKQV